MNSTIPFCRYISVDHLFLRTLGQLQKKFIFSTVNAKTQQICLKKSIKRAQIDEIQTVFFLQ